MKATIPSARVSDHVILAIQSSRGGDPYQVTVVHPGALEGIFGVICPCKGYRHHGRCRHSRGVHDWLTAVIPPGVLPELFDDCQAV